MRSLPRRILPVALLASMTTALLPVAPAVATANATVERIAGDDRFDTARDIALETFPDGTTNAIIAYGFNFPDALAASYLSGFVAGPILLTDTNDVPIATIEALRSLEVSNCYVVGGTNVIGNSAVAELEDECVVARIAGAERHETAAEIAKTPPEANVGELGDNGRTAVVATSQKFADALALGPVAAAEDFPVLLTLPDSLPPVTADALDDLAIDHVLIPGGTQAVSAAVETAIESKGITVQRFAGSDRQATAVLVAEFAADELADDLGHVNVAAGGDETGGADALALAPHGANESPTLLCHRVDTCGAETLGFVEDHASTIASIHIAGGTARINNAAANELEEAARSSASGAPTVTKAEAVNDTTLKLTMSEPVQVSGGGSASANQFSYDSDGSGSEAPATAARVEISGATVTLTFNAGTVRVSSASDTVTYNDDDDTKSDNGDIVDANGNALVDFTKAVANPAAAEGDPTMKKAVSVSDSEIVVTFSEPVAGSGGAVDPAQFEYSAGAQGGQELPPVKATGATLASDGLNLSLKFPADTIRTDQASSQNPFDALSYDDNDDSKADTGDIVDSDATPMKDGAIPVDPGTAPTISSAAATGTDQVVLTMNEPVRGFGGSVSPSQVTYDFDGTGAAAPVAATAATPSPDGRAIAFTFPAGTVSRDAPNDVVGYADNDTARVDNGDVVDADGTPLANKSDVTVVGGDQVSGRPQLTAASAIDGTSVRFVFNEAVAGQGGTIDAAQFFYDQDGAGPGLGSPGSKAVAQGSEIYVTFNQAVATQSATDSVRYDDTNDVAPDAGDIVDGAGEAAADATTPVANPPLVAPVITAAVISGPTTIQVTVDRDVVVGPLDRTQWFYDRSPRDLAKGINPTKAEAKSARLIELTFDAGALQPDDDHWLFYQDNPALGTGNPAAAGGEVMQNQDQPVTVGPGSLPA